MNDAATLSFSSVGVGIFATSSELLHKHHCQLWLWIQSIVIIPNNASDCIKNPAEEYASFVRTFCSLSAATLNTDIMRRSVILTCVLVTDWCRLQRTAKFSCSVTCLRTKHVNPLARRCERKDNTLFQRTSKSVARRRLMENWPHAGIDHLLTKQGRPQVGENAQERDGHLFE